MLASRYHERFKGDFVSLVEHLRRQFAYDEWANGEVLSAIRAVGGADQRSLDLMAHILSAELLWLERLKQLPQSSPVWPKAALEQCEAQAAEIGRMWREYLGRVTEDDLTKAVSYKNSKGEPWTSRMPLPE